MEPELFYRAPGGEPQGRIGFVGIGAGGSMISVDNRPSAADSGIEGNFVYPTIHLGTEIWITSRFFVDLGGDFSLSTVGGTQGGPGGDASGIHDFRGQLGYRIHFFEPDPGPYVHFKLGYASESYDTNAIRSLGFTGLSYSGLLIGAGMGIPLGLKYGIGFDINGLLLSSINETPSSGGDSHGVYGWDFALDAYYRVSQAVRLDGKFQLLGNGAEFTAGPIQYAHQSGRFLGFDFSYYF